MYEYSVIITICVLLLLHLANWIRNILHFRSILNEYPGRKCGFLFGDVNSLSLQPDQLFLQFRDYAKEFPKGFRMYGGQYGTMNFITAETVEIILSSSKHIEKSVLYKPLLPWLNTGLLTSSGSKWFQRRKILTPAFHFNILRRFITIFGEQNERFIDKLRGECNKPRTNIVPLISQHALNIICETAMGISMSSNDKSMIAYQRAIHGLGDLIVQRALQPWFYFDFIYFCSPAGRKTKKYLNTLHQFTTAVIDERERTFNKSVVDNLDNDDADDDLNMYAKRRFAMLDLLILTKKETGEIDQAGIREEVDTFMFEGHDTVSMAISFTLFMLANHKDIQDRARAEVDEIFQGSKRPANYKDLQNMQYMKMVIKETMRLYPSVPLISRLVEEDILFDDGKCKVPAGCMILMHIYDLHLNSKVFPNPEKFDPDRFLPENVKGRHPYTYIPFSAGPRNCIGQKFAMLELKSTVSSILRHYEVEPVDSVQDITLKVDIVLRPTHGIHVQFKPRKSITE